MAALASVRHTSQWRGGGVVHAGAPTSSPLFGRRADPAPDTRSTMLRPSAASRRSAAREPPKRTEPWGTPPPISARSPSRIRSAWGRWLTTCARRHRRQATTPTGIIRYARRTERSRPRTVPDRTAEPPPPPRRHTDRRRGEPAQRLGGTRAAHRADRQPADTQQHEGAHQQDRPGHVPARRGRPSAGAGCSAGLVRRGGRRRGDRLPKVVCRAGRTCRWRRRRDGQHEGGARHHITRSELHHRIDHWIAHRPRPAEAQLVLMADAPGQVAEQRPPTGRPTPLRPPEPRRSAP